MKWILAFTVNIRTKEATLINKDYEGSKTYKGAVIGWYGQLDGKTAGADYMIWAIIEHEV